MDRELADLIAQYASEAQRAVSAQIPGYLSVQNISRLFHFTSIHNLESIVTNGFLGRDSLRESDLTFTPSDNYREEPLIDGVCFSLSRPNTYMAARKILSGQELILLELAGVDQILTNYNFVVSPGNFGSSSLKKKIMSWPEEFVGAQGLLNLFKAQEIREKYSIPSYEPTDPQAEIIILERLPWSYVDKVYFPNSAEYSVTEYIRSVVRKLPAGIVLQSQIKDVFPEIDWRNPAVVTEYNERKWHENWTSLQ